MELSYADQLRKKETLLQIALEEFNPPRFFPSVESSQTEFRNKAKFSVSGTIENPTIGLLDQENLDQGKELLDCPLHVFEINSALPAIKEFITLAQLSPYQVSTKKGELKGLILLAGAKTSEISLRFVLRSKEGLDRIRKHKDFLFTHIPGLTTLSANIQPIPHAILEGEEEIFFSDTQHITHRLGEYSFHVSPRAFLQTNPVVAEKLYSTASEWVKDLKVTTFVELFSGQGPFSFFCSESVKQAFGIELNDSAVKQANEMALRLGLKHLSFKTSDAGKVSKELAQLNPELVLVNPPRRGLGEALHVIRDLGPQYLIYSSCAHETLAKDLKVLSHDYEILKAQIFDMFPQTSHFETLVLLKHR
jgi:23S rRNA (uracil747-C5)-methyltransferase